MTTVVVSATYTNGDSVIQLPDGWSASDTWLLFNGQVWAGSSLVAGDATVTVPGIDLSGELIQLTDVAAGSAATSTSTLTSISDKLDALLASAASYSTGTSNTTATAISAVTTRTVVSAELTASDLRTLRGMDCDTGKLISGIAYLRQRITDALMTPKYSQVLLRARGSTIPDLIDQPMNQGGNTSLIIAISSVLSDPLSGVPDFILSRVSLVDMGAMQGRLGFTLTGQWLAQDIEVTV